MTRLPSCTRASHDAIKADPVAWSGLAYVGTQRVEAGEDFAAYDLVIKNCGHCFSSLAVEVPVRTCPTCKGCGLVGVEARTSEAVDSAECPECDGDGECKEEK